MIGGVLSCERERSGVVWEFEVVVACGAVYGPFAGVGGFDACFFDFDFVVFPSGGGGLVPCCYF